MVHSKALNPYTSQMIWEFKTHLSVYPHSMILLRFYATLRPRPSYLPLDISTAFISLSYSLNLSQFFYIKRWCKLFEQIRQIEKKIFSHKQKILSKKRIAIVSFAALQNGWKRRKSFWPKWGWRVYGLGFPGDFSRPQERWSHRGFWAIDGCVEYCIRMAARPCPQRLWS